MLTLRPSPLLLVLLFSPAAFAMLAMPLYDSLHAAAASRHASPLLCQDAPSLRQRLKEVHVDPLLKAECAAVVAHKIGGKRVPSERVASAVGLPLNLPFGAKPRFVASADRMSSMPPESLPEVAFIGRSNVGKSSLLNALVHSAPFC